MKLAVLYIRVSSSRQEEEGYSLDAQEKLGREYAKRKGYTIIKSWKVSESAWKEDRTNFNQMIDYVKKHNEIRHIIFDITDRMTRNDFDKIKITTLIKDHDKVIHIARANKIYDKNSNPDDIFVLDIEVAVAKKMSNDISRKTKMGMTEKAEQGLYPSFAPVGYMNDKITHLIKIDPEKAHYVKRAFSLVASGQYSLSMLVDLLYQEGFRGKNGNRIGKSVIAALLRRPIYCGYYEWGGKLHRGSHEPIISKGLFDQAQDVLNGKTHPSRRANFAFNNLITCGICDCKVIGERKKNQYNYYHCTFSKGRHSEPIYIREEKLIEKLGESIKAIMLSENIINWLKKALKENGKDEIRLQEQKLNTLKKQYEIIKNRLSKLYDAKFDNQIPEDTFKLKEREYNSQLREIDSQIQSLQTKNPNSYENLIRTLELSKCLYPQYVRAIPEKKAKMLKLVASNYTLSNVSICPKYRKPFDIIAKGLSRPNWLPGQDSNLQPSG